MSSHIPTTPRSPLPLSSRSPRPLAPDRALGALPAELLDQVVDHLHDAPRDLQALSLVASAFRPAAQFHLFGTVRLSSARQFAAFVAALASNTRFAPLVRALALHEGRVDRDAQTDWVDDHLSALPKLPNLASLALHLLVWDFTSPDTRHTLTTAFPTVRSLELVDCVFGDFCNLRTLLGAFPDLDTFDASFCHWRELTPPPAEGEPDLSGPPPPPRLRTLRLSGCPQGPVARWLLRGAQPGALTALTSRDTTEDALRSVGALCAAAGPALGHLHLSTWYHWGHDRQKPEWLAEKFTLAHNPELETLRIDLPFVARDGVWLPAVLGTLASRAMRAFTLDLYVEARAELACVDWARVGAALGDAARLPALARVDVIVRSKYLGLAEAREVVEGAMPALARRGVVNVRQGWSRN